jgi:hypothetical protein
MIHNSIPSVRQHSLNSFLIAFGHQPIDIEKSLSLIRLFGQDVARMRMAALDLAGSGHAKSLRRAFVCF